MGKCEQLFKKKNLNMPENIHDNKTAEEFQKSIYEFFVDNYGTHDNSEQGEEYADHSKKPVEESTEKTETRS